MTNATYLWQFIKNDLEVSKTRYFANDNISEFIAPHQMRDLTGDVEKAVENLLRTLLIDIDNDHNTKETAKRVAKMFISEVFAGRYKKRPEITFFPNDKKLDELYTLGPIDIRSACSHHLVPILGKMWIGVIPNDKVVGISKLARLADWHMARPQIQEEGVIALADDLEEILTPRGLAIVFKAKHFCMSWRGVKQENALMTSSIMRGVFKSDLNARQEFLQLIKD